MAVSYQTIKKELESTRQQLNQELQQFEANSHADMSYSSHMADEGSMAFDQARDLALKGNLERKLQDVEEALKRLDTGLYGVCKECGQNIDPARLKALPHTLYCLDCQRRREM